MAEDQNIGGPGDWLTDFGTYTAKNPNASDQDLFKHFPQLSNDPKRLDAASSYLYAKGRGTPDDQLAKMYPDLIPRPAISNPMNRQPEAAKPAGPTVDEAKTVIQHIGDFGPSAPELSKNPTSKPLAFLEKSIQDNVDASNALQAATTPVSMGEGGMGTVSGADPEQIKAQQAQLQKTLATEQNAAAGTLQDIQGEFLKHSNDFFTKDGVLDYGKVHDYALQKSAEYGGGRAVAEQIYNTIAPAAQAKKLQPETEAEFQKLTGKSIQDWWAGANPEAAKAIAAAQAQANNDYQAEVRRSQDLINQKANDLWAQKYQGPLNHLASMYGPKSEQVQQATDSVKASMAMDLRSIQTQENARLLRIRDEKMGMIAAQIQKTQGNPVETALFNSYYNKAYQNVLQAHEDAKSAKPMTPFNAAGIFAQSLYSGANSWLASRGAGLVGAGFNNGLTDWLRSRQTAAETYDIPNNPVSWAGKTIGGMAPDVAAAVLLKNPLLGGLEITGSSTLAGIGEVYNQAKAEGASEAEAQAKGRDFAGENFATTLPLNLLMSSAILSNLKGAGGAAAGIAKEALGGVGAGVVQQYNTQAQGENAKGLGQFLQEDAPKSAAENLLAMAAGAGIMRGIGTVTKAMSGAGVDTGLQQHYSQLLDEKGKAYAYGVAELKFLNGVLDAKGLLAEKQMINGLIQKKAGLSSMGTGPDQQKLYLDAAGDAQNLKAQAQAAPDEIMGGVLNSQAKEKENLAKDVISGNAPYIKLTPESGPSFVLPVDKGVATLQDPELQQAIAAGGVKAEVFGKPAETADAQELLGNIRGEGVLPEHQVPGTPMITEVRHGVTNEDNNGVTSGPTSVPLNAEGKDQAAQLADELQGQGVNKVVSSALPRAVQTARTIAEKLGIPHEQMPELNSWNIGDFDKTPDDEFKKAEQFFVENPDATEFEGKKLGESFNQYKNRVIAARQQVEDSNSGHTLLVNHGGNINIHAATEANGGWNGDAAKAYLNAPEIPPAELPKDNKSLFKQAAAIEDVPDPHGAVLQHFANGGRIDPSAIKEIWGGKDERLRQNASTENERRARIGLLKKGTGGIDDLAHSLWEQGNKYGDSKYSSQDYREAIEDVLQNHTSRASAARELVDKYDPEQTEAERFRHIDWENINEKSGDFPPEMLPSVDEAGRQVLADLDEGRIPDAELQKWLSEEAENTYEDEPTDRSGNRSGTDKDSELLPAVQKDDAAETGDRANPDETQPRAAGDSAQGSVRETSTRPPEATPEDEGRTAEDDDLARDLAGRLGKKLDRFAPIEADGKPNSIEQYLTKASAVLHQLFPDHDIKPYYTEKEYMEGEKRPAGSAGVYDRQGKYIALNLERIRSAGAESTVFHEVIHPIVQEALEAHAGAVDAAYSKLVDLKDVPGMEAVWQHEDLYRGRGMDAMKVEAITEFLTHVADGRIDPDNFPISARTRIIDAINRVLKALGINKTFSTAQDIRRLADTIKEAFKNADASPVEQALGRRTGAEDNSKMDAMIGKPSGNHLEDFVREKLDEHKQSSIRKALIEVGGMKQDDAQALIDKIHGERTYDAKQIIRDAIAKGKASKKQQPLTPAQIKQVKPGLSTKLKRWYYDGVDQVSDVKSIIRKNKGEEEFAINQIYHATRALVNMWNKVPAVDQMAFMLGVEKPDLLEGYSQEYKDIAQSYRDRMDQVFDVISTGIPGLNYIHDYFPHFWEKPDEVRNYMANTLSKAPLEGGKSFAKKRFFETLVSGLNDGYKLATTNPEEIVRLAEANAWKFKTARDILSDMDAKGLVQMAPMSEGPQGWQTVKDPAFQNMAMRMKSYKTNESKMAALYMPPEVAKLVNDYLSPGIKGPVKGFVQQYNNIKNLFQLGVGFFHLGTTSLDAMVSGVTNGIQKLTAGHLKGIWDIATMGNLPTTIARGFKARSDYNKGIVTKDTQALIDANARVGKQKMYSLDAKYNMMKSFGRLRADGDFSQIPKIAWNAMLYLPEAINKPLMEHYVPALKVGGYLRALDSEIGSRPNMTPEELQNTKQKLWDSMDDRLGQVVYDNVFMNKTYKDMAFMAIRSAGWTGGTLRAVSGGIGEIPRSANRLVKGQGLSQRTAYLLALPFTVGVMGGFLHRMMTGQNPDELKDYFFPKDGTQNPDGTDHRADLPSYMKDILAYSKQPVTTMLHKTAPLWNEAVELYNNKDYYGEKIYNKDDPMFQKGLDILKYEGQSMEPFSFKKNPYDTSPFGDQFTTRQGLEQKFGIMPAPKERERNPTQNAIAEAYHDQVGTEAEGKTHAEMEQSIAKRHLREFLHDGGDYKDASDEWKMAANISARSLGKFIHDAKMDPFEREFRDLKPETKIQLYEQMSDAERAQYGKWIAVKDRKLLPQ